MMRLTWKGSEWAWRLIDSNDKVVAFIRPQPATKPALERGDRVVFRLEAAGLSLHVEAESAWSAKRRVEREIQRVTNEPVNIETPDAFYEAFAPEDVKEAIALAKEPGAAGEIGPRGGPAPSCPPLHLVKLIGRVVVVTYDDGDDDITVLDTTKFLGVETAGGRGFFLFDMAEEGKPEKLIAIQAKRIISVAE